MIVGTNSNSRSDGRSSVRRRGGRVLRSLTVAAAAIAAGCGGGTTQYEPFNAERVFAFGDENSTLTGGGLKYSINGVDAASGRVDCNAQPLWVQSVAAIYGFVFTECNATAQAEPRAKMFAADGAKVAEVSAQVDAQVAAGGFQDGDLATVLAGANDVYALYTQYPARSEADLQADARARGERLAGVINRLVALGAKVVVVNLPDLGISPYALAQRAAFTDTDRAALLSRLSNAFNEQLGVKVLLDGRYIGLVQADLRTQAISRSPASFGFAAASSAACTVAPPQCTSATLVTGADSGNYLWADDKRLSYGGQSQIAVLAVDRARRNPF